MTASVASIACVIPAFNAGRTVAEVVRGVRAAMSDASIIGIDDGSSDDTRSVLERTCDRTLSFASNRGKGAALRAGFDEALSIGSEAVVSLDADGQHDPMYAPRLVDALAMADVVVGARERRGAMPLHRRMTNALSAAAASRLGGCIVADAQSGFRALRSGVIRTVRGCGDRYEYETDFLIRAARAGFRITSVPVPTIYGPPSHFREVRDGLRVIATMCRHISRGAS